MNERSNLSSVNHLRRDRDRFVAFAFAASDMLMELNEDHHITFIDGATRGFLGEEADFFIGQPISNFLPDDQQENWGQVLEDLKKLGRTQQKEMTLSSRPFPRLPVMLSAVQIPGNEDSTFLSLSILQQEMKAEDFAARDLQTGLFNRKEYAKRAAERLKSLTSEGVEAKLSLVDIPELESHLEKMDPEDARQASREIADYLRSKSADQDTAAKLEEGVYSLVHKDDFEKTEIQDDIESLLKRLNPDMQTLQARLATLDGDVSHLNEEDSARAILFTLNHFADNDDNFNFTSLQDGYDSMLKETVENITQFKSTVENDSFHLAYQPIVDLKRGIVHHYEALVRLMGTESEENFANPFEFVNFGEQTGLINEFDLAMCHRALQTLDRAHDDNRWPVIAINLSGRSLSSQIFMDAMHKLLGQYGHVRKQLVLEVTESAKINDMAHANNFLQELRKRGHMCCLDDFGVAESSFDYLRYLHVDYIKIDGSYVRDNLNTTRGRHLLRAMVGMCRNLGMTTIAEMVEDETVASILWESGVHYGQGWLFGKPDTDESCLKGWNLQNENYNGMMRA
jgi:EAL domain-containing protein (putative c-di-GMP-specific phosphodiesterase class I)/GGDEF domain-containing protein